MEEIFIGEDRLVNRQVGVFVGKVDKGVKCSVKNCSKQAARSLNMSDAQKAKLDVEQNKLNKVYLCEDHYKIVKKALKKDRQTEKWRRSVI